jgi:hypothetical protein
VPEKRATPPPEVRTTVSRAATATTSLIGDALGFFGASGAGDEVLLEGPGGFGDATGDSVAVSVDASGAGGDDVIDLGEDGGTIATGDHSASGGTAVGSGNDRIAEGSTGEFFIVGDSALRDATGATAGRDVIYGRGGNDLLFGDSIDQNTQSVPGRRGRAWRRDQLRDLTAPPSEPMAEPSVLLEHGLREIRPARFRP